MKPLLKWAGGKARLAPLISRAFPGPCKGVYYEPFVGSGAVFLHRKAAEEVGPSVLSDANPKLVAFHRAIRDEVDEVIARLAELPYEGWERRYYEVRDAFNAGPHEGAAHAARFLWLNRAGFNGLYRENRAGEFNVPCGKYAALRMPAPDVMRAVSQLMAGVELVAGGFEQVLPLSGPGDQVYCDPPYVPLTATAAFTAYCKEPFGLNEQQELARAAMRAAFRGAQVVLSNHDLPLVRDELYPESSGFKHLERLQVARAISRDVTTRKSISEVIASIGPMRHVA